MPLYILSACRPADMTFAVDPAQAGTRMRGIARLAPSAAVLLLQVSLNPYSPSPLVQPSAIQEIEILEQKAVVRRREKKSCSALSSAPASPRPPPVLLGVRIAQLRLIHLPCRLIISLLNPRPEQTSSKMARLSAPKFKQ